MPKKAVKKTIKPTRSKVNKRADVTRAWKLKRRKKYDKEGQKAPKATDRTRYWVPGYTKEDGTKVKGHWRANFHAHKKGKFAKVGVGSKKAAKARK
ncbi:hypothetical protein K9M79_08910 [Candidatus Woesearchaeota archaeon]|nr:hypothetical protein [Candidatus Woesearchaeota archaeon]